MAKGLTRSEAAALIEGFIEGTGGEWDWDDFTSVRHRDAMVEAARQDCLAVADDFPAHVPTEWCGPGGTAVLRAIAARLREAV